MMSGVVLIDGNAGSLTGAARTVVVRFCQPQLL